MIQVLRGSIPQSDIQGEFHQVVDETIEKTFNSLLSGMVESKNKPIIIQGNDALDVVMEQATLTIFTATTVEELIAGLGLGNIELPELQKVQESDELNHLTEMDISNLITKVMPLLEKAGLSESEVLAASASTDIWSLLTIVDEVGPKLFSEMINALEGKGVIPKEQAIELLTILKTVEISAPKTDLTLKQEQQLFSLQGLIVKAAESFGNTVHTAQTRNNVVQMLEARQVIRFILPDETVHENLKDPPKETSQHTATNVLPAMRTEIAPAELESRNNARNETLLREMQAIFKRSNFGQTGGTNRLLIKLYPEHLGQVRIELMQTNGVMTARILASSALGKEMLDSQLHQLRSAFLQQNLQVERIDISQMLEDTSKNDHQHGMFNQHFKNEQGDSNKQEEQNKEEEMTFQEYMIELEA